MESLLEERLNFLQYHIGQINLLKEDVESVMEQLEILILYNRIHDPKHHLASYIIDYCNKLNKDISEQLTSRIQLIHQLETKVNNVKKFIIELLSRNDIVEKYNDLSNDIETFTSESEKYNSVLRIKFDEIEKNISLIRNLLT